MANWLDGIKNFIGNNGGSIASGVLGYIGQKKQLEFEEQQAQTERDWNEAMMEKQNEWNLNMWNMTNEYNSPTAQRARLEEAGLNPLYYGLDGSSASGMESAQALGYQRASIAGMDNPISAGIGAAMQTAQIDLLRAQSAKTSEETINETIKRQEMQASIKKINQEVDNLVGQLNLTKAEEDMVRANLSWLDDLNNATIAEKRSNVKVNDATAKRIEELLPGEKLLQSKSLQEMTAHINHMNAEIDKLVEDTKLSKLDIYYYMYNHLHNGLLGSGVSIDNIGRVLLELIKRLRGETSPEGIPINGDVMPNA